MRKATFIAEELTISDSYQGRITVKVETSQFKVLAYTATFQEAKDLCDAMNKK